jgi:adenosylhomocysteinase
MDDGADLVATLHKERRELLDTIVGGTEETTTGVIRLQAMARAGALGYPIIAVNEALTTPLRQPPRHRPKRSTASRGDEPPLGGQKSSSRVRLVRPRRGDACPRPRRHTIVTEISRRALEATMDGHQVMNMAEAAKVGDIFITLTGDINVLDRHHFDAMRDGAIIANSGHFNVEINIKALEQMSESKRRVREHVDEYVLMDGRKVFLLGEGRLINLAAAEGHPASVMDMSFANQALSASIPGHTRQRLPLTSTRSCRRSTRRSRAWLRPWTSP